MRKGLIYISLIAGLIFSGCGQIKEDTQISEPATEMKTETQTEQQETEKEEYVLTFEATTTEGGIITSDCLADSKLTMINVWATYCNPCLAEMPDLGEIAASYDKAEFQLLGIVSDVMEDDSEKNLEYARELIEETGADYPHMLLNPSLYVSLVGGIEAVPTSFFVTDKGQVLGYVLGARSKGDWEALIDELLAALEEKDK